jgi:hypothetical protein
VKPLAHRYLRQRLPKVRERDRLVRVLCAVERKSHAAGRELGRRETVEKYTDFLRVGDGETVVGRVPEHRHLMVALPPSRRARASYEPGAISLTSRQEVAEFEYQKLAYELESDTGNPFDNRRLVWWQPEFRGMR